VVVVDIIVAGTADHPFGGFRRGLAYLATFSSVGIWSHKISGDAMYGTPWLRIKTHDVMLGFEFIRQGSPPPSWVRNRL